MQNIKKPKLFSFRYFFMDFIRITGALPTIVWFRPKRIYENENAKKKFKGAALIISNHSGFYDFIYTLIAFWYRRQRFVIKKEIYDSKANIFLKAALSIPVDPQNAGLDVIKDVTSALKNSEAVTIFPEGHVNDGSGQMDSFKTGAALMAIKSKAPIVPMYIKKRESILSRLTFVIGEPIDTADLYPGLPVFEKIEKISSLLFSKEKQLESIAKGERKC